MDGVAQNIGETGFAIVERVLAAEEVDNLIALMGSLACRSRGGARNLLEHEALVGLARSNPLRGLVEPVLGAGCFAVRAIYFDKTPDANWKVPWHQDLMVAVCERVEGAAGYGAWSVKAGVPHVEPPVAVLERMLAVRLHLDDCGEENGPLRVIPGSHRHGRLARSEEPPKAGEVMCCVRRGGALLMRPLLLHASSSAASPAHRRVIHIEYAGVELPGGVRWRERVV